MLIGLGLVALNLRPAVTSVGPLLAEIAQSLGFDRTDSGILTTLPVLCFGIVAPLAPALGRRYGGENAIFAALIVLAGACALRLIPSATVLYLTGVVAGIAIGIMNVLLPGIVKRDFPQRVGAVTGFYTMMLCVGAAGAAALAPQVERVFDSAWPAALAIWAVLAVVALPAWAPMRAHFRSAPQTAAASAGNLWRNGLAWQVTIYLGLCSSGAYAVFGWGAKILQDRGMDVPTSGWMLGLSILVQGVGAQVAPLIVFRGGDLRFSALLMQALGLAGLIGYLFAPLSLIWLCSILLGLGQGGAFAISLTMIAQRGGNPETAARLSGMSQSVGYLIGAVFGPLAVALVHDVFGGWPPVTGLFIAITVGAALAAIGAGRARTLGA
ncbi:MAG TPA: MFS transporter [Candidatus Cybelea sp.]|nr:MFS transporter [Candidatus Cybelea sp.]